MKYVSAEDRWSYWVAHQLRCALPTPSRTICLIEDAEPIAGVLYESHTGRSILAHIAIAPGAILTRDFLFHAFDFPFNFLGVKRITGMVPASNIKAQRFDEHLGFKLEARLKDAAADGDMLVYAMFREDCRWLGNLRHSKKREAA